MLLNNIFTEKTPIKIILKKVFHCELINVLQSDRFICIEEGKIFGILHRNSERVNLVQYFWEDIKASSHICVCNKENKPLSEIKD